MKNEELNKARAVYYGLFCSLFSFVNEEEQYNSIVKTVDFLSQNPIDEYSKEAFFNMKKFFNTKGIEGLKEENNELFLVQVQLLFLLLLHTIVKIEMMEKKEFK